MAKEEVVVTVEITVGGKEIMVEIVEEAEEAE